MSLICVAGHYLYHLDPHSSYDATLGILLAFLIQNAQTHTDHKGVRLTSVGVRVIWKTCKIQTPGPSHSAIIG